MKFTKEKYPLLYNLSTGDVAFEVVKSKINDVSKFYYFSERLMEDANHNRAIMAEMPLIKGEYVVITKEVQYFVSIESNSTIMKENTVLVMVFFKSNMIGQAFVHNGLIKSGASDKMKFSTHDDNTEAVNALIHFCLISLLFVWHAPINQKVCLPKQKLNLFHCKYKSDIDYPITMCDESWYTECAQLMPFWVRRHLRQQRHGPNLKYTKTIWIEPFTKRDYTKGALKEGKVKERKKRKVFGASGKYSNN